MSCFYDPRQVGLCLPQGVSVYVVPREPHGAAYRLPFLHCIQWGHALRHLFIIITTILLHLIVVIIISYVLFNNNTGLWCRIEGPVDVLLELLPAPDEDGLLVVL